MRIGVDLDGVCYDFVGDARDYIAARLGVPADTLQDAEKWGFYEDWGLTSSEFWKYIWEGVAAGVIWRNRPPFPGTVAALEALQDAGHTIHICTSRAKAEEPTFAWLNDYGIPSDTVTIAADKTIVDVDCFIEDYEGNWRALDEVGVRVVLMDRPWNTHVSEADRVYSWPDFVDYVEALDAAGVGIE